MSRSGRLGSAGDASSDSAIKGNYQPVEAVVKAGMTLWSIRKLLLRIVK